jgi:hypothetical protein
MFQRLPPNDVCEFESSHPSHAVGSVTANSSSAPCASARSWGTSHGSCVVHHSNLGADWQLWVKTIFHAARSSHAVRIPCIRLN